LDADERTAGGLSTELLAGNSFGAGACLSPVLVFRSANMLNTKIAATKKLTKVRRAGCIVAPKPKKARAWNTLRPIGIRIVGRSP
jgi:hypothetical protein